MNLRSRLFVVAVVGLALAGCGVPMDDSPRAIPNEQQASVEGQPGAPAQAGGASSPKVFFLTAQSPQGGERLQGVSRNVGTSPSSVLAALLQGLAPDEQDRRLQTFIPPGTTLLDADLLGDGTLVIDVDDAFFDAKGESQIKAVAQVVYTATDLLEVERVRLLVDGQERDWLRGDGIAVSTALTPFDYPELNPSSQPDYPPDLG